MSLMFRLGMVIRSKAEELSGTVAIFEAFLGRG
jgi:hypothetical protein